jgi:hypothetical protein
MKIVRKLPKYSLSYRFNQFPWNLNKMIRLRRRKWARTKFSSRYIHARFRKPLRIKHLKTYRKKTKKIFKRFFAPKLTDRQLKKLFRSNSRYKTTFKRVLKTEHRFDILVSRLFMLVDVEMARNLIKQNYFLLNGKICSSPRIILNIGDLVSPSNVFSWTFLYKNLLNVVASFKKYLNRIFFKFSYPFILKHKKRVIREFGKYRRKNLRNIIRKIKDRIAIRSSLKEYPVFTSEEHPIFSDEKPYPKIQFLNTPRNTEKRNINYFIKSKLLLNHFGSTVKKLRIRYNAHYFRSRKHFFTKNIQNKLFNFFSLSEGKRYKPELKKIKTLFKLRLRSNRSVLRKKRLFRKIRLLRVRLEKRKVTSITSIFKKRFLQHKRAVNFCKNNINVFSSKKKKKLISKIKTERLKLKKLFLEKKTKKINFKKRKIKQISVQKKQKKLAKIRFLSSENVKKIDLKKLTLNPIKTWATFPKYSLFSNISFNILKKPSFNFRKSQSILKKQNLFLIKKKRYAKKQIKIAKNADLRYFSIFRIRLKKQDDLKIKLFPKKNVHPFNNGIKNSLTSFFKKGADFKFVPKLIWTKKARPILKGWRKFKPKKQRGFWQFKRVTKKSTFFFYLKKKFNNQYLQYSLYKKTKMQFWNKQNGSFYWKSPFIYIKKTKKLKTQTYKGILFLKQKTRASLIHSIFPFSKSNLSGSPIKRILRIKRKYLRIKGFYRRYLQYKIECLFNKDESVFDKVQIVYKKINLLYKHRPIAYYFAEVNYKTLEFTLVADVDFLFFPYRTFLDYKTFSSIYPNY